MTLVRILTLLERLSTNAVAAVLRACVRVLTRLLGRGEHRDWRRQAQEELRRRQQRLRP